MSERARKEVRTVETDAKCEMLINEFAENYIGKIFYFCLKKTGNSYEAEDLAQDISLSVFTAIRRGAVPESFHGYIWQIARNRYSKWAAFKHKKSENEVFDDREFLSVADGGDAPDMSLIKSEETELLRRELAFISRDYRDILVQFYVNDKKVGDIAEILSLPKGTVMSKLSRARKILKEGMNMARKFGKRSYNPEEVNFAASGCQPSGLPWTAVERKIPRNILLEADNSPSTIEELSVELGIAAPYMEEEVELLERATLLKKIGDKYLTNFVILSSECQLEIFNSLLYSSVERAEAVDKIADDVIPYLRELGVAPKDMSDSDIKWWTLLYTIDRAIFSTENFSLDFPVKRWGKETWGFVGYELTELPMKTGISHNGNGDGDVMLWEYKISGEYGNWNRVAMPYSCEPTVLLGDIIKYSRNISSLSESEKLLWRELDGQYAHADENGNIISDILVFKDGAINKVDAFIKAHPYFEKLCELYSNDAREIIKILSKNSSEVLSEQLAYCASMEIFVTRKITIHKEVELGRLTVPDSEVKTKAALWIKID